MEYRCWRSLDEVPKHILKWLNNVCEENKERGVCLCYVFDVFNNEVYLYTFKKGFDEIFGLELEIVYCFNVKENSLIDLLKNNRFILYKDLLARDNNLLQKEYYFFNHIGVKRVIPKMIVYDNLELLKDTIYKDTNIWKAFVELNNNVINISTLTSKPLTNSKFGYYIDIKQYDLAFYSTNINKTCTLK